ncbi:MAG TPA: hypothetical protein VFX59_19920 [Polyangiales bacterium]|nr:hypothetical protein [Polyangiales bacterium]
MTFGNLARLAALVALTGCITSGDARDEEYAIIRSKGVGYLRVSLDRNEYQSNNEPPTGTQKGSLSDEEWQRIQELTSDDKMATYVETSASDRAACIDDPSSVAVSTRKSIGGCWLPNDVTDAETKELLDFVGPLLATNVPNADGSPSDDAPKDAGRADSGTRDADRDR